MESGRTKLIGRTHFDSSEKCVSVKKFTLEANELAGDRDAAKSQRVMRAKLKMVKLDIKKLKQATKGKL